MRVLSLLLSLGLLGSCMAGSYLDGKFAANSGFNSAAVALQLSGLPLDPLDQRLDTFGIQGTKALGAGELKQFMESLGLQVESKIARTVEDIHVPLGEGKLLIVDAAVDGGRSQYQLFAKRGKFLIYDFPVLGEELEDNFASELLSRRGPFPFLIVGSGKVREGTPAEEEEPTVTNEEVTKEEVLEKTGPENWVTNEPFSMPSVFRCARLPRGNYMVAINVPIKGPAGYSGTPRVEGSCSCFQGSRFIRKEQEGLYELEANIDLTSYRSVQNLNTQLLVQFGNEVSPFIVHIQGSFDDGRHTFVQLSNYDLGSLTPGAELSVEASIYAKKWDDSAVTNVNLVGGARAEWRDLGSSSPTKYLGSYRLVDRIQVKWKVPDLLPPTAKFQLVIDTTHPVYSKLYSELSFTRGASPKTGSPAPSHSKVD